MSTTKLKAPELLEWTEAGRAFDGAPAGYYTATRPDGVEVAQARADCETDKPYHWESPVYELVRAADIPRAVSPLGGAPVSTYSLGSFAQEERIRAAGEARGRMTPGQRSPLDMEKIARDLAFEAQTVIRAYELEQLHRRQRQAASDMMVAQLLQLDKEFLTDEQLAGLAERGIHMAGGKA